MEKRLVNLRWLLLAACFCWVTGGRAAPVEIVLQSGHEVEVLGLVYSPDGQTLVSSGESGAIRVWDAESGDLVRLLPGHPERVRGLTMSRDGRLIASSSTDGLVKLWDYREGRLLHEFTNHIGNWVRAVAFSPDGRFLVPAAYDGKLSVWDVTNGSVVRTFSVPRRMGDVLFTPDGRFIITASRLTNAPLIQFWDFETGKVALTLNHSNSLANLAISRDGHWLASARGAGVTRLWELPEGRLVRTFQAPDKEGVEALEFSPDGKTLAVASGNIISLWDRESGRRLHQLVGHEESVFAIAFRSDGAELASGAADATIRQWNVRDGKLKRLIANRPPGTAVTSLAFSRDGQFEAQGTANGRLRLWNAREGTFVREMAGHEGSVQALAFTPDNTWLCSGSADRTMRVWHLDSSALGATYPSFDRGDGMGAVVIGGLAGWAATATGPWGSAESGYGIKIWEVMFDRPIRLLQGHHAAVRSIAFTPASDLLASTSDDATLKLWNAASGDCLRTLTNELPMKVLAFSAGSQWLVAGMADGTVRVLDTNNLAVSRAWRAHERSVQSVAFSDNGRWLATAGDHSVAVWDWTSGREVRRFTNVMSHYLPLAFQPGQPVLAFAQRDDMVVHARVDSGEVLFQRVLFPDGEWLAYNPAKAFYQSSPHGDEHARVRFAGQLQPVYPLTLYRNELLRMTNLTAALGGPAPLLAPKIFGLWWYRYEYKRVWLYGAITLLGALAGISFWRGWYADRRRRAQELFSRQLLTAQELERKRIAGELHDSLGQNLLIIKNRLYLAQQSVAGTPPAVQLEEISDVVTQTISEVREISHNLRPYQLDRLGLSKAVQAAVKQVVASAAIRIESELANIDGLFPAEGEIHFYRIVQECLNNILKHSDAATALISIVKDGGWITVKIQDDGRGFDYRSTLNDPERSRGFGLTGLHERVRILDGTFECDSAPGRGTRLTFEIPIPADEKRNQNLNGG